MIGIFTRRRGPGRCRAADVDLDTLMTRLRSAGWEQDGEAARRQTAKRITFVRREIEAGRLSDDDRREPREDER